MIVLYVFSGILFQDNQFAAAHGIACKTAVLKSYTAITLKKNITLSFIAAMPLEDHNYQDSDTKCTVPRHDWYNSNQNLWCNT